MSPIRLGNNKSNNKSNNMQWSEIQAYMNIEEADRRLTAAGFTESTVSVKYVTGANEGGNRVRILV